MELKHCIHEHSLIFKEEQNHDDCDEEVRLCDGCQEPISGSSYGCSKCEFFLHKFCAELPPEINHPLHPDHSLTLLPSWHCVCVACDRKWDNYAYTCHQCAFYLDIICATLMDRKILHKSHKHALTPLRKPALFLCDACGTNHGKGSSYQCTTCGQFWIHQDCASLPSAIKNSDHDHPLTLAYSLPSQFSKFNAYCNICAKMLECHRWVYHCVGCRYSVHVTCATSKIEPFMSILLPRKIETIVQDLDPNRLQLPPPNGLVSIINHFLKRMSLRDNERATELNHFSHHHPLILFNAGGNDDGSCSRGKFPQMNNGEILCDGCVKPISAPFYRCSTQCNYILHKCCAELPIEMRHPSHPEHPLILLPKAPNFFGLFVCECCEYHCNGFAYGCVHCQFYLDVICGSLPDTVKHATHINHLLFLTKTMSDHCNACLAWFDSGSGYGCDTCDFKVHTSCALLPGAFRHRYDEHPLTLNCSPVKDHPDEYICEMCEEEVDPKLWFYHCNDCDQSMHTYCVVNPFHKIKFRGTLNVDSHLHSLTFVAEITYNTICNHCGVHIRPSKMLAFECSHCKFMLHYRCAGLCSKQSS